MNKTTNNTLLFLAILAVAVLGYFTIRNISNEQPGQALRLVQDTIHGNPNNTYGDFVDGVNGNGKNQNDPTLGMGNQRQAPGPGPTPTPACTPTTPASVTVLSPNGGEAYTAGQQIVVKWKSCNIAGPVEINLIQPYMGGYYAWVLSNSYTNSGQGTFTIPTSSQWGSMIYGNNFKVLVGPTVGTNLADLSDNLFTINELPDLKITNVTFNQSDLCVSTNANIRLTMTVKNDSNVPAVLPISQHSIEYQPAGSTNWIKIGTANLQALTIQPHATVQVAGVTTASSSLPNLRAKAGTYKLRFTTDASNVLSESNENNNTYDTTILINVCGIIQTNFVSATTTLTSNPNPNDDIGVFKITFDVTALGGDIYVPSSASKYPYQIDRAGTVIGSAGQTSVLVCTTSCTAASNGNYVIYGGQTERFELYTTLNLSQSGTTSGLYRMVLDRINYNLNSTNIYSTYFINPSYKTSYLGLN